MYATNTPARGDSVAIAAQLSYDVVATMYEVERVRRGLTHVRRERFGVARDVHERIARLGARCTHSERSSDGTLELVVELSEPASLLLLTADGDGTTGHLSVAARTLVDSEEATRLAVDALRGVGDPDDVIALRMWSKGPRDASYVRRVLDASPLGDVAGNYPADTRRPLTAACGAAQVDVGGLALWYGPPGTGKTTAVRTLTRAWRAWCDVHVVLDPEVLLHDPAYLMQLITEDAHDADLPADAVPVDRRSRLVVLEDAGELLAADARARTGQGLSRLLNVTDGLAGRGLRTSVLITTNEELGTLHPAVRRPGRCWAQVRFGRFAARDARAWLAARGIPTEDVVGSRSLAELFAIERGERVEVEDRAPLGFRA